jgi:Ohr subfamily peroxiredoxin
MSKIEKVLVTGKTRTTASESSHVMSRSRDGSLNINLSSSGSVAGREHGFAAIESHPTAEQLFAGAWSACYITSVGIVALEKKVVLPPETSVDVEVDLGQTGSEYFLQARINLNAPGIEHHVALAIAHAADELCPYSKAMRENIDIALGVTTS